MSELQHLLEQAVEYRASPTRFDMTPEGIAALHRREDVLRVSDAHLKEIAPDLARLLIDMADWISGPIGGAAYDEARALLARFAELERRAAPNG